MGEHRARINAVLIACVALVGAGCAHTGGSGQAAPTLVAERPNCVPMKWLRYKNQPKAAVVVPVMLDGRREWFQLDTGTPYTTLFGRRHAASYGFDSASQSRVAIDKVRLAGVDLGRRSLKVQGDRKFEKKHGGTLGLDFLVGHLAILNFQDHRFCMLRDATPTKALAARTRWVKGALRDGHLFFDFKIGDRVLPDVLYDSGSNNIVLWVDRKLWTQLTGIDDPEKNERLREGLHWGTRFTVASAPAQAKLSLGGIVFGSRNVSTVVERPDFFKGFANGLFGNAPFLDYTVVLSLGPTPALGVIRGVDTSKGRR